MPEIKSEDMNDKIKTRVKFIKKTLIIYIYIYLAHIETSFYI